MINGRPAEGEAPPPELADGAGPNARPEAVQLNSGAQARFLATMSHELRTPLNVVIGFSEAMLRDTGRALSHEQIADYATSINVAGRQLLTLVDVILDVARIESGQFDMPSELMDIGHLITSLVTLSAETARTAALMLTADVPADLPLLRGDERRIRQALAHMLGNAIKFTPVGGQVRIAVRLDDRTGDMLVMVSDTGIGIADGDLQRAFEPFVQLDASLARRFPGSGLGLYVSRITARAHGGDLILSSQPSVGTTAVFRIPPARLVQPAPSFDRLS